MARSETWTVTPIDKAGHRGPASTVNLNWTDAPSAFQFGVTIGANDTRNASWGVAGGGPAALVKSYSVATAALGRDLGAHVKFFGSSGIAKAVQMWQASPGREPAPLLTSEVFSLPAWSSFLDTLTVPVRLCYDQEFSQFLRTASTAQVADFNSKQAQLANLIATHPQGALARFQLVGQEFQERQALAAGEQPIWKRLTPIPGAIVGGDCYVTQDTHLDVVKATKASVEWYRDWAARVPGVTLGISEAGVSATNFTSAQRIKWLTDMAAYLPTVDPHGSFNYWITNNSDSGSPEKDWTATGSVATTLASLIAA